MKSPKVQESTSPSGIPTLRRGFNLIELLIALAITATLLVATLVALNASFTAYQRTTEEASTQTIGRLTMHRILAMIRTGDEFRPLPANPLDPLVESDYMDFRVGADVMSLQWIDDGNGTHEDESLYVVLNPGAPGEAWHLLLQGVKAQYRPLDDPDRPGERILPFTLEYEKGRFLHRATIDLAVTPDDNMSVELDGKNVEVIRLVASAAPRTTEY